MLLKKIKRPVLKMSLDMFNLDTSKRVLDLGSPPRAVDPNLRVFIPMGVK